MFAARMVQIFLVGVTANRQRPNLTLHDCYFHRPMIEEIDQAALAALCPELRAILDAELAAGNTISEASRGAGKPNAVYVALRRPFLTRQPSLPP